MIKMLTTVALLLTASPALTAQTCVIVYANDVPFRGEVYWHEMAHCNGWEHPERKGSAFASGYKAYQPPKKYLFKYPGPLRVRSVSTNEANLLCDSYGCFWFQ